MSPLLERGNCPYLSVGNACVCVCVCVQLCGCTCVHVRSAVLERMSQVLHHCYKREGDIIKKKKSVLPLNCCHMMDYERVCLNWRACSDNSFSNGCFAF